MYEITTEFLDKLRDACEHPEQPFEPWSTRDIVLALIDHIDDLENKLSCAHHDVTKTAIDFEGTIEEHCEDCGTILWTGHSHIKDQL